MDLLFSRYSDPMKMIDLMINSRRFLDFCVETINIRNEETEEKTLWEFYIHRVFDESYADFKESLVTESVPVQKESVQNSISESFNMLNSFKLEPA